MEFFKRFNVLIALKSWMNWWIFKNRLRNSQKPFITLFCYFESKIKLSKVVLFMLWYQKTCYIKESRVNALIDWVFATDFDSFPNELTITLKNTVKQWLAYRYLMESQTLSALKLCNRLNKRPAFGWE
jgi:hypothetical protein